MGTSHLSASPQGLLIPAYELEEKAIFHLYLISMLTNKGQGSCAVVSAVPALNNHPEM